MFEHLKRLFIKGEEPLTLEQAIAQVNAAVPGGEVPEDFGEAERALRIASLQRVAAYGIPINTGLDLFGAENFDRERSERDVFRRLLVMYGLSCAAYGVPRAKIFEWLDRNTLLSALSPEETEDLEDMSEPLDDYGDTLESQWALMWVCSLVPELDPARPADHAAGSLLPSLPDEDIPERLVNAANLWPDEDLKAAYDLNYCLYSSVWFARQNNLAVPRAFNEDRLERRLHALEWIFSGENWDDAYPVP